MAFRQCVINRSEIDSLTSHQGKYLGLLGVQEKGTCIISNKKTILRNICMLIG